MGDRPDSRGRRFTNLMAARWVTHRLPSVLGAHGLLSSLRGCRPPKLPMPAAIPTDGESGEMRLKVRDPSGVACVRLDFWTTKELPS